MFWGLNAGATPFLTKRHSGSPVLAVRRFGCPLSLVICKVASLLIFTQAWADLHPVYAHCNMFATCTFCQGGIQKTDIELEEQAVW